MAHPDIPVTPGIRFLRSAGAAFEPHWYRYEDHGGTSRAAQELGLDEHAVIKTLVFRDDRKQLFLVLMHGDREVSSKQLARVLGARSVEPCDQATAERSTGYVVGGISPFGTRTHIPVCAEETIFALPVLYVNGGKRGFLVSMTPALLEQLLQPRRIAVATQG